MDYEFGDIFDARSSPLGHFVVIVGTIPATRTSEEKILYYVVSSRIYKVFRKILDFFNYCINKKYQPFFNHFSKERDNPQIARAGRLCTAFFLDYDEYTGHLEEDSYLLLNNDPAEIDASVLSAQVKVKTIKYRTRLGKPDLHKLMTAIRYCDHISPNNLNKVSSAYNIFKRSLAT